MIITCSLLLILIFIVFLVLFICLSRRHLVGFLCASIISLLLTFAIYFVFIFDRDLSNSYQDMYELLTKLNTNVTFEYTQGFTNCAVLSITYIVMFIILESIIGRIINRKDNNVRVNKTYHFTKVLLIIVNLSLTMFFVLFTLTNLNIIYEFEVGLFKPLFDLIKEGILLL